MVLGDTPDQPSIVVDETNASILVVDGQPEDRQLIARLVARFPLSLTVVTVGSVAEAMDHLAACQRDNRRLPELVLIDFDLPDLGGARLLTQLRRHEVLRRLPVVVLTRRDEPDVVRRAYDFGANAVINRSASADGMGEIVRTLIDFWFRVANRYLID